jgi:hypothetical protein
MNQLQQIPLEWSELGYDRHSGAAKFVNLLSPRAATRVSQTRAQHQRVYARL